MYSSGVMTFFGDFKLMAKSPDDKKRDEVLKRMLQTPHKPHKSRKAKVEKAKKPKI